MKKLDITHYLDISNITEVINKWKSIESATQIVKRNTERKMCKYINHDATCS